MLDRVLIDIIGRDKFSKAADTAAASASRAAKTIDRASAATTGFSRKVDAAAAGMMRSGSKLTKAVTVPMLAIGVVSLDQAAKFQKANTLLQTAGGETVRKMKTISGGVLNVAEKTGEGLSSLESGMYTVAKAGGRKWSAVGQLKVLTVSAEAAKAENSDLATQVDATTSIMQSYGLGVGKVVQVENMLIRGSGLAKTTMQQFAGSLSNVVPLAAALHIGVAQVFGSLDTMTQHGEGVQRSAENLNNLITNLAGNNNVASSTMQQLGIKTIWLQRNIGRLGLSGALDYVEKKLAASSKGGMVVVRAFKESQLATHSLDVMLKHMSGTLHDHSVALLNGSMSYTDYRKAVRAMGGPQSAMGQQFLTLQQKAQGWNDSLKSGNGDVQTAAAMLKKMLGGMTGMRTALMLTGKSAKQNASNIREVTKAGNENDKHVLGWNKTSKTFSLRLDKMKASAQVFAVKLGTDLLPVGEKVISWLSAGVHWFDKLSPSMRHTIEDVAAVTAIVGPALMIGGKLIRTVKTLWTVFAVSGAASRDFSRGIMGAEVSTKTMGSTAWTAGAKVRTAFGGAASAASLSAKEITDAEAEQTRAVVGYTDQQIRALSSLRAYRRTMTAETVAQNEEMAASGGMRGGMGGMGGGRLGGKSMGVGLGLMLGGQVLGNVIDDHHAGSARNVAGTSVGDAANGALVGSFFGPEGMAVGAALGAGYGALKAWIGGASKLSAGLQDLKSVDDSAAKTINRFAGAVLVGGKALKAHQAAAARSALSNTDLVTSAAAAGLTEKDLTNAITGNVGAYDKVVKVLRDSGAASEDQISALEVLRDQYKQGTTAAQKFADIHGLVIASEVKTANQTAVLSGKLGNLNTFHLTASQNAKIFHDDLDNLTKSVKANGTSLDGNTLFGQRNIAAVRDAAAQSLAHAQAVYHQTGSLKLADKALENDRQHLIKTATQAGLSKGAVKKLADEIDHLTKTKHGVKLTVDVKTAKRQLDGFRSFFLGYLASMPTWHPKIGGPSRNGVNAPGLVGAPPNGGSPGSGHATGGSVADGWFTVGEEGGPRGWELGHKRGSKVEMYSNRDARKMTGLDHLPGYAKGTNPKTTVSKAVGEIGSTSFLSNPLSITSRGEFERVERQIAHATAVLDKAIVHGLSSAVADRYRSQIARLAREAERQFDRLQITNRLASIDNRLGSAPSRPTAYDRLATAKSNYAGAVGSAKSAVLGTFDITSAGQVYNDQAATGSSILASLRTAVGKARQFGRALKTLRKMGLSPVLLAQFAQAGPGALDQANALISSGGGTISKITAAYADLDKYGAQAGKTSADYMYGAGVKSAQKIVNGLLSQRAKLRRAMRELAHGMVSEVERSLHLDNGHASGKHHHGHRRSSVHVETINIYEQRDAVAAANAVTRRLAHLGAA